MGRLHRLGARRAGRPRAVDHRQRQPAPHSSADGNTLFERGRASGNLPGTVEVTLTLRDHAATSTFTIHTTGGTIGGHGTGKLHPGSAGYDSFGGTCAVTHGTGRFRGASGACGLYGSIYRVDDSLRVQVTGKLRY